MNLNKFNDILDLAIQHRSINLKWHAFEKKADDAFYLINKRIKFLSISYNYKEKSEDDSLSFFFRDDWCEEDCHHVIVMPVSDYLNHHGNDLITVIKYHIRREFPQDYKEILGES